MRAVLVLDPRTGDGDLALLADDGTPTGPPEHLPAGAVAARVAAVERDRPRWVWPATSAAYPVLLRAGVVVERCHDLDLTDALLEGHAGRWRPVHVADDGAARADTLFGDDDVAGRPPPPDLAAALAAHAHQLTAVAAARAVSPGFGLLVAAESAAALAAAEMGRAGLPWDAGRHDALLEAELGPRPAHGGRPAVLLDLARQVADLLDAPGLAVDSQPDLLRALRRAGLPVRSTRKWELEHLDHPVVAPLRRYKELARLHAANGWAWREEWVRDGRFRPEYVPGGVVSGRWASRGGGALQIPRALRGAVVADHGHRLVVADAGQLEPRVLAALSHDAGMLAACADPSGDLYTALARQAYGLREVTPEQRAEMKVALLAAMYGGGAGQAGLAALRRRFPTALAWLEDAARRGEDGGLVRSVLGRTCPPPRPGWLDGLTEEALAGRARARGRFTRNFVVQASAADWANVLVASLRLLLPPGADLVLFQHDEVVVHAPQEVADDVAAAVRAAGEQAGRLVLPEPVPVPLSLVVARAYDEKG